MLFLLSGRLPRSYPIIMLIVTNLVISMPAPPIKRSPENAANGFSTVPKILEIQLPLKIASKDDLVAWAKYVMGLMASRINITLTTIKDSPATTTGNTKAPDSVTSFDNTVQPQIIRDSMHRNPQVVNQMGGVRNLGNMNQDNVRYAANVHHLGNMRHVEIPATVRPLENGRRSEMIRIPVRNFPIVEKQFVSPQLSTLAINGVTSNSLFNTRQTPPSFTGFFDTTIPSPLEITANINLPRTKEPFKNIFNPVKISDPQMFVPQLPDPGPNIDLRNNILPRNFSSATTPSRTYLPVATTDNVKIPNDPFVTRYFFDGVERKVPNNLAFFSSNANFTTNNPIFNDKIPIPVRNVEPMSQRNSTVNFKPLLKVPFEAVITFTRENAGETTTWRNDRDKYVLIPTRDPPDEFPPYFDTNYTLTNESGQINVVFEDDKEASYTVNDNKKEERKKQGKKQDSSKKQQSKKKSKAGQSVVGQFLKTFVALRNNNSLTTDLKPPPLNPQKSTVTQKAPATQKAPVAQRYPPPPRTQNAYNKKPPSALRQGRRGQTSLAQEIEDDDDNGSDGGNSEESTEKNDVDEDNGNDDVESNDGNDNNGSDGSSSSESEEDSDEEDGGFVRALIELLNVAAPILEDLSDPESDADLGDVFSAAVPFIQELSEGDGENPGFDIPGILVPILLKLSENEDGPTNSVSILTPLIQTIAPLIGPLVGPLIMPLSRQISNPIGEGGSSITDLINSLLASLLQPIGPGKMSQLSNLVAGILSSLSKYSAADGNSDVMGLVKAVVAGTIAGTSAASSGQKDSYGHPMGYGVDSYGGKPSTNTYAAVPPKQPNPLLSLGDSFKDILTSVLKLVGSLVNVITGVLSSSSNSAEEPSPTYGAPRPSYGPPRPAYSTPRPTYSTPRPTYGAPRQMQAFAVPPSDSISITTSSPKRFLRL